MKRTNELLLRLRQLVNDAIAWKALDALDGAENQKDGMEISEAWTEFCTKCCGFVNRPCSCQPLAAR